MRFVQSLSISMPMKRPTFGGNNDKKTKKKTNSGSLS